MTSPREAYLRELARAASPTGVVTTSAITSQTATSNTTGFPYAKDVGVDSIAGIQLLARSSGVEIKVVSSFRAGANGYHGTHNAVDFGGSQGTQRYLAAYLYQFSAFILELIHTDPGVRGGGFYVHNGQKVPQSFYNGPDVDNPRSNIIEGHRDHVHCAMTMSGLRAASANSEQIALQAAQEALRQKPAASGQSTNLLTGESATSIAAAREKNKGCSVTVGKHAAAFAAISSIPLGILVLFT